MKRVPDLPAAHSAVPQDHLSWSALTCFRTCPLKYYFRYIARLPEETHSASLLLGGAIHRALARYFTAWLQGPAPPSLDQLLDEYQAHWIEHAPATKRWEANNSAASLLETARRMLAAFLASPWARPRGQVLAVEETLSVQLLPDVPRLVGVVDLILGTGSELILIDWKTSRGRWSEFQVAEAEEQLLLYGELARSLAPAKRICLEPVVLTKSRSPIVESYPLSFNTLRLQRTKGWIAATWRAIKDQHYYPTPSALACGGCAFRENCRAWKGSIATDSAQLS